LKNPADFKGTKNGIQIQFNETDEFDKAILFLREKLTKSLAFYKDAEIIGVEGRKLTERERVALYLMLDGEFGLKVSSLDNSEKEESTMTPSVIEKIVEVEKKEVAAPKIESVFVRKTLRSGVSVKSEGDLVVVGDVNPGAEVIAAGNIVIMGTLRGVAHAGCKGNRNAIVAANKLLPTQLRIDTLITRSPEDEEGIHYPEVAVIKDGQIVIEPYN